ncbi:dissimilatory sulfite reductase (desulfoviridin) alpha/beta subunit [Desulfitispora alkaliphila]|uniref:hypothetical protein n=1 Tax=Desulfitispora alkaliphila TaxID=622674 RepID=UPI003D1953D1
MRTFFSHKQSDMAIIRLRVPVGILYPEQLDVLKQVACRYGDERLHLTVRKTVEIPGIPVAKLSQAMEELAAAGLRTTTVGDTIRNVMACPGTYSCPNSIIDTQSLGLEIDSNVCFEGEIPSKMKIAIAGCANGCTSPQVNDIGIVGINTVEVVEKNCEHCYTCVDFCREKAIYKADTGRIEIDRNKCVDCGLCADECEALKSKQTGYRISVGGKLGRHLVMGRNFGDYSMMYHVLDAMEKIVFIYKERGKPGERLGETIDRIGFDEFKTLVDRL